MTSRFDTEPNKPYIWDKKAEPVRDSDDKRGKWRKEIDKIYMRGFFRYLGDILEITFPHLKYTIFDILTGAGTVTITIGKSSGSLTSDVKDSVNHTCPDNVINGNVRINGNLTVNGNVQVTGSIHAAGDIVAGTVSLKEHTHTGTHGVTTKPN